MSTVKKAAAAFFIIAVDVFVVCRFCKILQHFANKQNFAKSARFFSNVALEDISLN